MQNVSCMWIVLSVMNLMKASVLSAKEFYQLTVNSLLELCTHCIDGHCIVSIEGHLQLTLDTGDKVELDILQQDVGTSLKSEKTDDANIALPVSYLLSVADRNELCMLCFVAAYLSFA